MASRTSLTPCVQLASALALLVAVMASPIRPALSGRPATSPPGLRRNFGIPPSRLSALPAVQQGVLVRAIASEDNEQPRWAMAPTASAFNLPPVVAGQPACEPLAVGHIPLPHPLRC